MKTIRSIPLAALAIAVVCGFVPRAGAACETSTIEDFAPQMAPAARAFLASPKTAVRSGDKYGIAAMVKYPLRVNDHRGNHFVRSRSEFLKAYDQLFDRAVNSAVLSQSPACLFANWQGVMIGRGVIWFEQDKNGAMRIKTINLPS